MDKYKILSEVEKYQGIRIDIVDQEIRLPDGRTARWELIKHIGAAAVVPIDENGKVIMVSQFRNSVNDYVYEIPAGVLNYVGEDPMACAARELEEEIGYKSNDIEFLAKTHSSIGSSNEIINIYLARNLIKTCQKLDEDEFIDIKRFTVEELFEMIEKKELTDSKTIIGLLMYDKKYRKRI